MIPSPAAIERPNCNVGGSHQTSAKIDDHHQGVTGSEFGINLSLNLNVNVNLNLMNCNYGAGKELPADYNCSSSNYVIPTDQVEASATTTSTLLEGQVTPSHWDQNLDFDGLSCSQILGLADGFVGSQQSQSQSQFYVEQIGTPNVEEKTKVIEKDEVPVSQQKKKKQKIGIDLNKKPGEKRQNKYYWPKIDVEKKPTPKPKTPNPVTPKPKRKYTKKNRNVPKIQSEIPGQVVEKTVKNNASCKQALKFDDEKVANIGLDTGLDALGHYSSCQDAQDIAQRQALGFEAGKFTSLTSNLSLNPLSCSQLAITANPMWIIRNLNLEKLRYESQHCSLQEESLTSHNEAKESDEQIEQKSLRVYHRRLVSKCLKECQKLGINFPKANKRSRMLRDRKSMMGLQKFEEFYRFSISTDLLDRIAIVRGKKRMVLPTKGETARELCPCVLSLLSSAIKLRTKKRSTKRVSRLYPRIMDSVNHPNDRRAKLGSPWDVNFTGAQNNQLELQVDREQVNTESQMHPSSLQNASVCSSNIKGNKPKVIKQKRGRPGKSKTKNSDYLSMLSDWHDASLEQIMDPLVRHFESMELYDNPKTLERWSVMNNDEGYKGDNGDETYEEKLKWEEERKTLLHRIAKFIYVMTRSQGPRDFVKWKGSVLDSVVGVFLTQNVSDVLSSNAYIELGSWYPLKSPSAEKEEFREDSEIESSQGSSSGISTACSATSVVIEHPDEEETAKEEEWKSKDFDAALNDMFAYLAESKGKGKEAEEREKIDWEGIRVRYHKEEKTQHRNADTQDSVDWDAVRRAPVHDIAKAIHGRGQHQIIAAKIKKTLNRLVEQHGSLDLEWLREASPQIAKAYLLSFYGLGLKSVECLRLLTLHHHAFPVDVNIARVVIRLGWVPLKPLPMGLPFHRLQKYPLETEIQKYLWPRLCHLDQKILYKLHCHMITFGKVFCVKKNPNCGACPFKGECKYYASLVTSKLRLPRTQDRRVIKSKRAWRRIIKNPFDVKRCVLSNLLPTTTTLNSSSKIPQPHYYINPLQKSCEPIVEMPSSPEPELEPEPEPIKPEVTDIEDLFTDKNDEIIQEIKLNFSEELKPKLWDHYYFENTSVDITISNDGEESSRALVSLSPEDASIPLPKHMLYARLRTEHQVYELPDFHPLLKEIDRRDEKDPLPYLLAVWTPDQIKKAAEFMEESNKDGVSLDNNAQDESLTVPGTLLIPSRTAMRGFFPLNGTYFQVNEVFADDESSQRPIDVPRIWLWNLPRRTLYCGSGITSIFRGLTWREIQRCCCEGFVCTRGFNRKSRAPKKLHSRLHVKTKLQEDED